MEHPLKTLLYELFIEPVLRLFARPTMRPAKVVAVRQQQSPTKIDS
jgi:hypothetical protein